ncbi:MAG TPA: DUF433 domain-containing protein [Ardenticatenaceae bacterium]|jgi:uncharacterized protein (DUF433 family)
MTLLETRYEHIILNDKGVPVIAGTTMKVIELVLAHQAYSMGPDELHDSFPYLSMGQIYSALAYYWDHKEELDEDIQRRHELVEQIRRELGTSPLMERLKAIKRANGG